MQVPTKSGEGWQQGGPYGSLILSTPHWKSNLVPNDGVVPRQNRLFCESLEGVGITFSTFLYMETLRCQGPLLAISSSSLLTHSSVQEPSFLWLIVWKINFLPSHFNRAHPFFLPPIFFPFFSDILYFVIVALFIHLQQFTGS